MKLAHLSWPEVAAISRETVVLVPTGSLEQHGPHLPLFTDSLLVTRVAEEVEARCSDEVLLTPTLWLGASGHHLAFPGTLSASFSGYEEALTQVILSLKRHGFHRFFVLNGHGGNTELNGIALRKLKEADPSLTLGHSGYFAFIGELVGKTLTGPLKEIRHACEAEASLMLHLFPELVRQEKLRDDGLRPSGDLRGMVHLFDEITEQGSYGFATLATAEKGKILYDAAVAGCVEQMRALAAGYTLDSIVKDPT